MNAAETIQCDDCGQTTADWDWRPVNISRDDRVCLKCLAKSDDEWSFNPRADRGCWEAHQEMDR